MNKLNEQTDVIFLNEKTQKKIKMQNLDIILYD